jgi:hypothetical protein
MTAVCGSDAENITDAANQMLGADKFPPVEPLMIDQPGIGVFLIIYLAFNFCLGY